MQREDDEFALFRFVFSACICMQREIHAKSTPERPEWMFPRGMISMIGYEILV